MQFRVIETFFEQSLLEKYYRENDNQRAILNTLLEEWINTKEIDVFLILYMQVWLNLEDVYMENVDKYYNHSFFEKTLLFDLMDYGNKFLSNNARYLLLTGYMYSTTSYLLWDYMKSSWEELEQRGKKIISELYSEDPQSFMNYYFYTVVVKPKKRCFFERKKYKEMICELFPSNTEIDMYFSDIQEFKR